MYEIVVSRNGKDIISLPMDRDSVRLGRSAMNDLQVPAPTVSRHQCEIIRDDGGWLMKDRSGNGTLVDGKLRKEAEFKTDSFIGLGNLLVRIRSMPEEIYSQVTASGSGTSAQPTPLGNPPRKLTVVGRVGNRVVRAPLNGSVLTIGSNAGNDLVVNDPYVSAFHCRILRNGEEWYLYDLESTNGTIMNGIRIVEAPLEPRSSIKLGNTLFAVREEMDESEFPGFHGIVSEDQAMHRVFDLIERVAPTDETVLITGDSGTGKELVAKAVHLLSPRSSRSLVTLNCSAISKDLVESELFGHEKGAFTGAHEARKGIFEASHLGTIFLDEIGELSSEHQARLLRVLEYGEVRPIGRSVPRHVDTRVLAGTNRSIAEMVKDGTFRKDLYYRLNVIELKIPPLRERPKDIPLLAKYFLDLATKNTSTNLDLTDGAVKKLEGYSYPGNVRELKHTITRAVLLTSGTSIGEESITFTPPTLADMVGEPLAYRHGMTKEDFEIQSIRQALETNQCNLSAAARDLGISRTTLYEKMRAYGITLDTVVAE